MSKAENKETDGLSRLSRALKKGGIELREGGWLEQVLNESDFETEAWSVFGSWLNNIETRKRRNQDLNTEEYLEELREQLTPILENFSETKREE